MSFVKPVRGLALGIFLLFFVVACVLVYLRRSGMPERKGTRLLNGLDAQVMVRFNEWGVPHIQAETHLDAFRTLGYLHANDRMTQMELGRRAAAGRLAEIVGEVAVPQDVYFHAMGFPAAAETLWQSASDESKAILEAYAQGVNAWLDTRKRRVPPGLQMLRVVPDPWTPKDSLAFALLMAQDLSFWNQRPEEERFQWLRAFGSDGVRDLLDDPDLHVPEAMAELAGALPAPEAGDESPADGDLPSPGSNNWAVGGSRTDSGKPLLANDPHLGLFLPSVWYQAHLRSPEYEAAGMTLPGTPGVVIGRGPSVAWAFTNTMLDDHDVFFEQLDEDGRVRRGDEWVEVEEQKRSLKLRGGGTHRFTLRRTDIGPLLDADEERGLPARSVSWTAHHPGDPIGAFFQLAAATTPEEVQAAVEGYVCPSQNLVASFPDGTVMHTVIGRIPDRRLGDGRLPSPAWDSAYGWNGLRPRETNPTTIRPADDLVVTANHDIRPDGYALPLTAEFFAPYRADRIRERLLDRETWNRKDFAHVQVDALSLYAVEIVAAAAEEAPFEGDAQTAFEILEGWDGRMELKGPSALFALFNRELGRRIFADESRVAKLPRSVSHRDRVSRVLRGKMDASWLDDVTTDGVETRRDILQQALAAAWKDGAERWGTRIRAWNYGQLHSLRLKHRLDAVPAYGAWTRRGPYPVAGSATTVLAFGARWREDGLQEITYGPSMRWVVDWAEPDKAWAVIPGGQSGHPSDEHYDDQIRPYLAGELHEAPWSEEAIHYATVRELRLFPPP